MLVHVRVTVDLPALSNDVRGQMVTSVVASGEVLAVGPDEKNLTLLKVPAPIVRLNCQRWFTRNVQKDPLYDGMSKLLAGSVIELWGELTAAWRNDKRNDPPTIVSFLRLSVERAELITVAAPVVVPAGVWVSR